MARVKERVRGWLPRPLWVLLRRSWAYLRGLGRWGPVLVRTRGDGPGETLKLYLSALAAPVTALPRDDAWYHPAVQFDTRVRVRGAGRFLCRGGTDDLAHAVVGTGGSVWRAIAGNLGPGGIFIDGGANIGGFTVPAARLVGPQGRVIAIEMMPDTAMCLRHNLGLNGLDWVLVVEGALSDTDGTEVTATMSAGNHGQASIVAKRTDGGAMVSIRIRTLTLDGVLANLERIDVLKLDLEGAEVLALQGGPATLARTRCVIFEDWGGRGAGRHAAERIGNAGFGLRRLDGINMIGMR